MSETQAETKPSSSPSILGISSKKLVKISYVVGLAGFLIQILGLFWFFTLIFCIISSLLAILLILCYQTQNSDVDEFLRESPINPLQKRKTLGICSAKKQNILLLSPNIKIHQTEQTKTTEKSKKSGILDGIFLEFKRHGKQVKDGFVQKITDNISDNDIPTQSAVDKKKSSADGKGNSSKDDVVLEYHQRSFPSSYTSSPSGSPKKYKILSNNKEIDKLLHTIIDYIIRDFIDSWFSSLSDNKEFVDINTRSTIEDFVINICKRIRRSDLVPMMATKLIDDIANHSKLYRLASQSVNDQTNCYTTGKGSPMRATSKSAKIHRRNKSDTDLKWNMGGTTIQKNIANSTFYATPAEESNLLDPEKRMIQTFFENSQNLFKKECFDDHELEKYLTSVMETILYFTLTKEDFESVTVRTLLASILANVVFKPLVNFLADPDFINLQICKQLVKEVPSGEFLIKIIRQCNDLSELRAVRQLITKEMDMKYKDLSFAGELASLKYTQKLIDIRISNIQNNKYNNDNNKHSKYFDKDKFSSHLPLLTLDEILTKELALSYYLDYLSILNLQKYVIFYLVVGEWKRNFADLVQSKKEQREDVLKQIRHKAHSIYTEYLMPSSSSCLNIDQGLVEVLHIKIKDHMLQPDPSWFESISKFVYEKLKNEDVFLQNFYQSLAYKKLLLELEVVGQNEPDLSQNNSEAKFNVESGSDSNSGDLLLDDDDDLVEFTANIKEERDINFKEPEKEIIAGKANFLLDPNKQRFHQRSHSDTGLIMQKFLEWENEHKIADQTDIPKDIDEKFISQEAVPDKQEMPELKQKLLAKIINTAIISEGQYAVYAIQVMVLENQQQKSWHIYRRYSKFLEFKKLLTKRFPTLGKLPFPAKKTFQNTQRSVLEFRMGVLNDFLMVICTKAEYNDEMCAFIRDFLEPDTEDKKYSGGSVVRTLVNPLKSGIRSIRNMPDTFIGGLSRLFLGKSGAFRESNFMENPTENSEYPALSSVLNLMDEVFDLQARSQWLRRGLINRLLGASFISQAANKKILIFTKNLIEKDKIETVLIAVLNAVWPDGVRNNRVAQPREDSTKLRTKMMARIALFALLSDDLKHVLGSETTRIGLLNFFEMLQNVNLNKRLVLVLLHNLLTTIFPTDSMTKHVMKD